MIIKNCFVVAASYAFFVGIRGSITHFLQSLGYTTISRMSWKKRWWLLSSTTSPWITT